MINKEALRIFYFLETIDKMYFFPDDAFGLNLDINDKNPKNPRIVELFYFPYQNFHFENLYRAKRHYSFFEMENDGKIYEIIDKSSPDKHQLAKEIISFIDKDLAKAQKTVNRSIATLINIYAQTIKGIENMIEAIEEGRDLHILKDAKEFKDHLKFLIDLLLPAEYKLIKLIFKIQKIAEYTILYEKHKKLYEIKVRFVANYKNRYAYYKIRIDDDKIKVSIEVEYNMRRVLQDIYKSAELVVRPFGLLEWLIGARYREKATKSWYYFLRPTP